MSKTSFIQYVIQKINEKCTIVTKILLAIVVMSSFIPIPMVTTDYPNLTEQFIGIYGAVISVLMTILIFTLLGLFIDFSMETDDDKFLLTLYIVMVISPIASISAYILFNIFTPFQFAISLPTIVAIVIYLLDLTSKIKIDTSKIEKIFIKK